MTASTRVCLLLLLLSGVAWLGTGSLAAQALPPTGAVTGTITAADTQRPMRFAKVTLTPVKSDEPDLKGIDEKTTKDDPAAAMKAISALMGSVTMLQGQTGLDGTYTIGNVAPGDYYLIPSAPGYVSPAAAAEAAAAPDAKPAAKMVGVPVVHVEANRSARGDASLPRGAAFSGRVVFDDGSPAAGMMVTMEEAAKASAKAAKKAAGDDGDLSGFGAAMSMAMSGGILIAATDDRGHFRLAGVPAGDYEVKVTVSLGSAMSMRNGVLDMTGVQRASPMMFYAPGTLHEKDATRITAHAGEERGDVEIKVDLTAMKSVRGRVTSAVDHHGLNSGTVTLVDTNDKALKRTGSIDADGNFMVSYVPAGTWKLDVADGADTEASKKKPGSGLLRIAGTHTLRSYEDGGTTVIVAASDVAGVVVELKEAKATKKDVDLGDVLGGSTGAAHQ